MTNFIVRCSEYFTNLAINEVRRVHPRSIVKKQVSPQDFLVQSDESFAQFSRPWRETLPIYVHQLFPLDHGFPLDSLDSLCFHAKQICADNYAPRVTIVGRSPYHKKKLEKFLMPPNPDKRRILSLLLVDKMVYMGLSWANQLIDTEFAIEEAVPNRAGLKLLEAIHSFQIRLRPKDKALDLGAAPGAWTEILLRRGLHVTAVAPREMYDWLYKDEKMLHVHQTAEEYLQTCHETFDFIVNDMILDAQDSARLMVAYAEHLRPEGIAVMTLKLRMWNINRVVDHSLRLLRKRYKIIRLRQLLSNKREITLFLRRKS
jgi:23S rRNA U2552 (ribose-2'-O)-methylase RlmE/FtsJ